MVASLELFPYRETGALRQHIAALLQREIAALGA
jgi:hypothetical protein